MRGSLRRVIERGQGLLMRKGRGGLSRSGLQIFCTPPGPFKSGLVLMSAPRLLPLRRPWPVDSLRRSLAALGASHQRPIQRPLRTKSRAERAEPHHVAGFRSWRINDLKHELDAIGCTVSLEPHGQGYKDMSPAVDIVERLVIRRKPRHGAHPVLQWCATNAVVTRDPAGGRKFDKAKSTVTSTRLSQSPRRCPWRC
jgi:hypothetical protein